MLFLSVIFTSTETTKLNHTKKMIKVSTSGCITKKKLKAESQRISCLRMFIAAPFTQAGGGSNTNVPSTEAWINKIWHEHTVEYHSAFNRKEILSLATIWMRTLCQWNKQGTKR